MNFHFIIFFPYRRNQIRLTHCCIRSLGQFGDWQHKLFKKLSHGCNYCMPTFRSDLHVELSDTIITSYCQNQPRFFGYWIIMQGKQDLFLLSKRSTWVVIIIFFFIWIYLRLKVLLLYSSISILGYNNNNIFSLFMSICFSIRLVWLQLGIMNVILKNSLRSKGKISILFFFLQKMFHSIYKLFGVLAHEMLLYVISSIAHVWLILFILFLLCPLFYTSDFKEWTGGGKICIPLTLI
jgi:hypothetical protein